MQFERIRKKIKRILSGRRFDEISARFDISDVVQESTIQVWRHAVEHDVGESKLNTCWLRTIATGHFCKLLRFHLATKRSVNCEASGEVVVHSEYESDPASIAETRERAKRMMDAVNQLEPLKKLVFVLRYMQDKTLAEIAKETSMTIYSVRMLLDETSKDLVKVI